MNSVSLNNISALLDIIRPSIADKLLTEANFPLADKTSTEEWISNLSATNFANNSIELYQALPTAARLDVDPNIKMDILDSLTPTVIRSTECLLQSQLNQDTAKAISLGQALIRQVYEGYKLVIYQLGKSPEISRQETTTAIAKSILNACNVLAKIQLNSLSHYLRQPTYFWRELHALHLLAEQLDIVVLDIPNPM
jgi:hypothetical protein